jgi:hypothetical protein
MSKTIAWCRLLGILLVVLASSFVISVHAAGGVSIDSQSVGCSAIAVTYTVTGGVTEESAQLRAYAPNDQQVGSASGPGSSGQHTVTIPLSSPQPTGTMLYVYIVVGAVSTNSATVPCSDSGPNGGPWIGYTDDRLNPAPDEYYSIWCRQDQVEIWRSIPDSAMFSVPLSTVFYLVDGGSFDAGNNMTITRSGDLITVYGSNGNLAPASGSKNFSLSECVSRNGREPEQPANEPVASAPAPQTQLEYCSTLTDWRSLGVCWILYYGGIDRQNLNPAFVNMICPQYAAMIIVPPGLWARRRRSRSKHQ